MEIKPWFLLQFTSFIQSKQQGRVWWFGPRPSASSVKISSPGLISRAATMYLQIHIRVAHYFGLILKFQFLIPKFNTEYQSSFLTCQLQDEREHWMENGFRRHQWYHLFLHLEYHLRCLVVPAMERGPRGCKSTNPDDSHSKS